MSAKAAVLLGAMALGVLGVGAATAFAGDAPVDAAAAAVARTRIALRAGLAPGQSAQASDAQLEVVIESAEFGALTSVEQHAALAAAARAALQLQQPQRAHELAVRATALPEQGIDDWSTRLSAALRLRDAHEEVLTVTTLLERWGSAGLQQAGGSVARVAYDAEMQRIGEPRLHMLELLYDQRWTPQGGGEPSALWRQLSLGLLERGDKMKAQQVGDHVTDPYELVAMLADRRYAPILKSPYMERDVRKAADRELEARRSAAAESPRSLEQLARLLRVLEYLGHDAEGIAVADEAIRRSDPAGVPPAYDDIRTQLPWILNLRAEMLADSGRFEESLVARQRACEIGGKQNVGVCINLAGALIGLTRPDEALARLPAPEALSPYGRMVVETIRVAAAAERGDDAALEAALGYLRAHEAEAPEKLQEALVVAGRLDEAVAFLKSQLEDPELRSNALMDLQDYLVPRTAPERVGKWRAEFQLLRARPEIQRAIAAVGTIGRYPLRSRGL